MHSLVNSFNLQETKILLSMKFFFLFVWIINSNIFVESALFNRCNECIFQNMKMCDGCFLFCFPFFFVGTHRYRMIRFSSSKKNFNIKWKITNNQKWFHSLGNVVNNSVFFFFSNRSSKLDNLSDLHQ